MVKIFNYIERSSPIHRMSGASKLAVLLLVTLATMITFDTPFLLIVSAASCALFPVSKIRICDVKFIFILIVTFMVFNGAMIYLFAPEQGVAIYGTRHLLFTIAGRYTVTQEQLLYQLNVMLKYVATAPFILIFVATTNPSELAASLNRIGVSYKISYSVALMLRYIPDLIVEYQDISHSQQARGIEMSKKGRLSRRVKAAAELCMPLILSSVERIEYISNAMELRKFGTGKRRTWIMGRKFGTLDYIALAVSMLMVAYSMFFLISNGGRYWNPFV